MTESLAKCRRVVLAVLIVTPLLAIAVGGLIARRSLRPVRSIIRAARSIGTRDLHARIKESGTGDAMDQLAATLNGMLDRIEQKVREVQRFTADASHELRTPLTALRGNAEMALLRHRSPEELRQTIEESITQYERLQRIADDLLLLTRLDAHELILKKEPVSLAQIADDVVDLYAPIAEEKGLYILLEKPNHVTVRGDGGRLRQVVGNLLDNAIKHTPASGNVTLSIAAENGLAHMIVADSGLGISAEDLPCVFDRFFRVDSSRSATTTPGVGLGLSICRSIVEAHGGTINIRSAGGTGTTVTVNLPLPSERNV